MDPDQSVREAAARWVASLPSAAECARAEVEPFLHMTIAERLAVFAELQREAERMLAGRIPVRDPAEADDFAARWRDPAVGRPAE